MTNSEYISNQSKYLKNVAEREANQTQAENNRKKAEQTKKELAKKNSLESSNKFLQDSIDAAQKRITDTEDILSSLYAEYNTLYAANPSDPLLPGKKAVITGYRTDISKNTKLQEDLNKEIEANNKKIKDLNVDYSISFGRTIPPKTTKTPGVTKKKIEFSKDYKYNIPMISTSYFQEQSIENTILDGNFVDQGTYPDARRAWQGVTGGRGTIQMDKKFLTSFSNTTLELSALKQLDRQKYGFKFLYNPQTISMAWGLMQEMDPLYEATQYDPFQTVAAGLMTSTVTFDLLLNRIKDFDYIGQYGLLPQTSFRGEIGGYRPAIKNPYPETVPNEDLIEIWDRGTMYDIEYFLKTINGPDGTIKSALNGTTADKAYLRPAIVELHLGNRLRYRVRISSFSVNHVIFNNRMVPMLSTVRLTCNRFIEGVDFGSTNAFTKNTTSEDFKGVALGNRPLGIKKK